MTDAEHIARLELEIEHLRGLLGTRVDLVVALQDSFRLTHQQAVLVSMVHAARGRWVRTDWLEEALPIRNRPRSTDNVKVHIHYIRKRLGREAIESRGAGGTHALRLGPAAADQIAAATGALDARLPMSALG